MKSKRAEEFINGHIKIGNLQFTVADIEYCVMLAEQDAEEEIEMLKAIAVEAFRESCPIKHPGLNDKGTLCDKINIIGFDCNCPVSDCKFLLNFLQKLNEQ
jgi:hypothetical protein